MNLRILKKLSKRAAPYLPKIGYSGEFFNATKGECYHDLLITDRACWQRSCSAHGDAIRELEIKWLARDKRRRFPWCYMAPPCHPLKGTQMVGGTSGGECPEWSEITAWEALESWVRWECFDYKTERLTRSLGTPGEIFRTADELLAGRGA